MSSMRFRLLAIIFLIIIIAVSDQRFSGAQMISADSKIERDRPFRLSRHTAPEESTAVAFERVHCAEASDGLRVCNHISDSETYFAFEKNGAELGRWPSSMYSGGASWFDVLEGDLDGDGQGEIIVANCNGVSNGIGFQYWTISIFPDLKKHGFKPPLVFSAQEYGSEGTFVKHANDTRCNILATEWQDGAVKEPNRMAEGLYLVGRWFRYKRGRLEPMPERPILARRYLYGFQKERANSFSDSKKPLTWLKHHLTKSLQTEPLSRFKEISSIRGRILDVSKQPYTAENKYPITLRVKLDNGETATYEYSESESKNIEGIFNRLGDERSRIAYPKEYEPADLKAWLVGKRARVSTYKGDYDMLSRIIWVE